MAFPFCPSLHLISMGRSANWPVGCLSVCWMHRKSTLLETWQACCLYTSVLILVSAGSGSILFSKLQLQPHQKCSLCSDLRRLLLALGWHLLLQPFLRAGALYRCEGICSTLCNEDPAPDGRIDTVVIFAQFAVAVVYYSIWLQTWWIHQ